jgi:AraC family transcriptional regulator of adaptative response / DNA-3-methyladenine glycosylase II
VLDPNACYRALETRDRRFDGRFFTGVVTTGIYCRPVCPARTPRRRNTVFFPSAAAAEGAGFRACRRCRPEASPGSPAWLGTSATVARALRLISLGAADSGIEPLASRLGIGARQLRRLFREELGAAPLEIAQTRRTHFASELLAETRLPITEIAHASGFRSLRRFQEVFRETFGTSPALARRARRVARPSGELSVRVPVREPYDWERILDFLRPRAYPGVELVEHGCYRRLARFGNAVGIVEVRRQDEGSLSVRIDPALAPHALAAVSRVKRLFDCAADPAAIGAHLRRDPRLAPLVRRRPGLRLPGSWDGFETAVRAILGQQVSVAAATTLSGRLVAMCGDVFDGGALTRVFPRPEAVRDAPLASIGLPRLRAQALRRLAEEVSAGRLGLDGGEPLESLVDALCRLPGIGPWTAHYVAMRAAGEPDAFPGGDLILQRALGGGSGKEIEERSAPWRPWRAYAAMHLWAHHKEEEQ